MAHIHMLVSGESLRTDQVGSFCGARRGVLGKRLRAAVAHDNSFVILSRADREQMLASLDDAPWPLVGLRETMERQLQRRRRGDVALQRGADYRRRKVESGDATTYSAPRSPRGLRLVLVGHNAFGGSELRQQIAPLI